MSRSAASTTRSAARSRALGSSPAPTTRARTPQLVAPHPAATPTLLLRGDASRGAVGDLADSVRLLHAVAASDDLDRVVRVYRPWPTVAMTRRERLLPGFEAACAAARARGFEPIVRPTGGRAVAYDPSCLVIDVVERERDGRGDSTSAFITVGERFVDGLVEVGVDARLGPVPDEYCPGDYSVNARGEVKLVGTAQRVVRGARLVSGSVPLGPVDALVDVLAAVNAALAFDWNPGTFGTVAVEAPDVPAEVVEAALVESMLTEQRASGELVQLLRPAS